MASIFSNDKPQINTILNIKRPWQKTFPQDAEDAGGEVVGEPMEEVEEVSQQVNGGGDQTANHAPDETILDVPEFSSSYES